MKTKMICFIAFISYTFYLTAGDIYVSPYGNDKAAGTRQSPLQTLEQAIKQAREWRRLQSPETTGGINILLEEGIYPQYKSLFIRPEDSGTTDYSYHHCSQCPCSLKWRSSCDRLGTRMRRYQNTKNT